MIPRPFRVVDEDLAELEQKVRSGLGPLINALNQSLGDIVQVLTGQVNNDNLADEVVIQSLTTQGAVVDSFPFRFRTKVKRPRFVGMAITPDDPDHVLTTAFVMQGFSVTDAGLVSIPLITGLLPLNKYALTFLVRG